MSTSSRRLVAPLLFSVAILSVSGCSSDSPSASAPDADPTPTELGLVHTWQATSFAGPGGEFISQGMTVRITFASSGTSTSEVTGDLAGVCAFTGQNGPDCTYDQAYTATATNITFGDGSGSYGYIIEGATMTWAGTVPGLGQITWAFTRV